MTEIETIVIQNKLLYPFDKGLDVYVMTSSYADHLADTANGRHTFPGTDYAVWHGSPIVAPFSGNANVYKESAALGIDLVFVFNIGNTEYRFDFAHGSHNDYGSPTNVIKGTRIGLSGNSGFVIPKPTKSNPFAGTHVHVSLRINGKFVDPHPWLKAMWELKIGKLSDETHVDNILEKTLEPYKNKIKEAEGRTEALQRELDGLILTNFINIKDNIMVETKKLSTKLGDAGTYLGVSSAISIGFIALFTPQFIGMGLGEEQITAIGTGLTALINLVLVAVVHITKTHWTQK